MFQTTEEQRHVSVENKTFHRNLKSDLRLGRSCLQCFCYFLKFITIISSILAACYLKNLINLGK